MKKGKAVNSINSINSMNFNKLHKPNKLNKLNKLNTGFTLVELICAVAILSVTLVGLLNSYSGCFNLIQSGRNTSIALNEAQRIMEEARKRNLRANIISEDWQAWVVNQGCNCLDNEAINVSYPDGTGADPLQILLRVSWTEKGRAQSVELVTLLTER